MIQSKINLLSYKNGAMQIGTQGGLHTPSCPSAPIKHAVIETGPREKQAVMAPQKRAVAAVGPIQVFMQPRQVTGPPAILGIDRNNSNKRKMTRSVSMI